MKKRLSIVLVSLSMLAPTDAALGERLRRSEGKPQ